MFVPTSTIIIALFIILFIEHSGNVTKSSYHLKLIEKIESVIK